MEHNQTLKKIIAPIKGKGDKVYWANVGISGMKGGKQWFKFSQFPVGWDGYGMIVTMEEARAGHDRAEKATETAQEAEHIEDSGPSFGGEEGPGF